MPRILFAALKLCHNLKHLKFTDDGKTHEWHQTTSFSLGDWCCTSLLPCITTLSTHVQAFAARQIQVGQHCVIGAGVCDVRDEYDEVEVQPLSGLEEFMSHLLQLPALQTLSLTPYCTPLTPCAVIHASCEDFTFLH